MQKHKAAGMQKLENNMNAETADIIILALWFTAGAMCAWCVPDIMDIISSWRGNRRIGNRAASREARRRRELGLD